MDDHAYLGELAAAIFYFAAGVRLLRVAFRTGLLEERILGAAFSVFGISYLFYVAPDILPTLVPLTKSNNSWQALPVSSSSFLSAISGMMPFAPPPSMDSIVFLPSGLKSMGMVGPLC